MKLSETWNCSIQVRHDWSAECENLKEIEAEFKFRQCRWIDSLPSGETIVPKIYTTRILWDFGDFEREILLPDMETRAKAQQEVEDYWRDVANAEEAAASVDCL